MSFWYAPEDDSVDHRRVTVQAFVAVRTFAEQGTYKNKFGVLGLTFR